MLTSLRFTFFRFLLIFVLCCQSLFAQSSSNQKLESAFDASLNPENLRSWMKTLSARPHHVGSPYGKQNAEFIASQFKSWGYETTVEEFHVLFPTPKTRLLEMTGPTKYTASLSEPALKEDGTSGQTDAQLPIYNAYSIDGDVTGQLVYVNYGVPNDYEILARRGIDVKGKIVIARYGGSWRGIKPKVAAEHGAIGCIIYSDPKDDGYYQGDVYPKGAYKNEWGAQRGSVADMPLYAGDPLTPFIGATKDAKRVPVKEAQTLTKIPVLPISYSDALPLLKALEGPVAPDEWKGALPVTYHIGPGPATVHLNVEFNWDIKPAYDVIAKITGSEFPDQWIIRGNHHDAWVNGADDPISGQVAMMEEARGLGLLVKNGWKPKRTIIYAAWDAEEPGLLGSTEWVETHADALKQKAVVYINSDSNGRGFFYAGGSHTLEKFVNAVARDVIDPQTGVTVEKRMRAASLAFGSPEDKQEAKERADFSLFPLGSGSDYTPFLQHLGIASLTIGYGGEDGGGSYHSIYDSYDHYSRFGDPTFEYGIALAKTGGRMIMRLADAVTLPFEFINFTENVGKFVKEVVKLTDDTREETERTNRLITENSLKLASDPKETYIVPAVKEPVPFLNFAPLHNAMAKLQQASKGYDDAISKMNTSKSTLSVASRKMLDEILFRAERALTVQTGLPRRPWFKHHIYAPGFYTGYGVKTLPGIREAIEQRNWKEAEEQIGVTAGVIERFTKEIEKATEVVVQGFGK